MTTNPPHYTIEAGSLAERVIAFFMRDPDEELTRGDVALKFEVPVSDVTRLLKPLIDDKTLVLTKTRPDDPRSYKPGVALREAAKKQGSLDLGKIDHVAPPPAKPKPAGRASKVLAVSAQDIEALQVEVGVPLTNPPRGNGCKWTPLLAKLTDVGMSVGFPAAWKSAVAATATKTNRNNRKAGLPARYKVRYTTMGKARAWRVE